MKRVLLIRHGSTAGNLQKRYVGRTDEPLCEQGIREIRQLQEAGLTADLVFVSPALRTVQSAEMLFAGSVLQKVPELWETDFGIFEGKNAQELSACSAYRSWVDSGCMDPVPGGESVDVFRLRCSSVFRTIMEAVPDGCCAAFVIHGGCIMAILEAYAQPKRDFYSGHIKNGEYVQCDYRNGSLTITGGVLC